MIARHLGFKNAKGLSLSTETEVWWGFVVCLVFFFKLKFEAVELCLICWSKKGEGSFQTACHLGSSQI